MAQIGDKLDLATKLHVLETWLEFTLQQNEDINYVSELYSRWDRMDEILDEFHVKQVMFDVMEKIRGHS